MNKIAKISSALPLVVNVLLIATLSACSSPPNTASDTPTNDKGEVSAAKNSPTTQDDAQSETRKKQVEADNRAKEQRNNVGGDSQKSTEENLVSEVRNKLESNLPGDKLTVTTKNADVTVSGEVKTQGELDKIKPLVMEIKGVKSVMVKAVVKP
ncbi:BON domain-containing protein [Limnofasciculus baicalensis]|uniref:BON domain-containing protein n=1 Tax=Limnofasciculus baicalensis BBK-W-15 TaxID=2699891 RepID=A0AAE3GQ62_9CYAN|nr:BON domain-containing protein [Limnofasciculus baicalensis]MCP2728660.1 BON domain-containing protein [Limnofasciculus baicalensis BBK-W-15]